jgi:TfoX/Sxy family transcriptional regulator of competence genes
MAYNEALAERINRIFSEKKVAYVDKKMMGGLCYMVDDKMCVGVVKDELMARIGEDAMESALQRAGCRVMDFTKRPMKGYIFVGPDGTDLDRDLEHFVQLALDFNPMAKSSKKKKK